MAEINWGHDEEFIAWLVDEVVQSGADMGRFCEVLLSRFGVELCNRSKDRISAWERKAQQEDEKFRQWSEANGDVFTVDAIPLYVRTLYEKRAKDDEAMPLKTIKEYVKHKIDTLSPKSIMRRDFCVCRGKCYFTWDGLSIIMCMLLHEGIIPEKIYLRWQKGEYSIPAYSIVTGGAF